MSFRPPLGWDHYLGIGDSSQGPPKGNFGKCPSCHGKKTVPGKMRSGIAGPPAPVRCPECKGTGKWDGRM